MYPSLHADLGKRTAAKAASEGFHIPPSGLGRLLAAFGVILALALFLDVAGSRAPGEAEGSVAAHVPTQQRR